MKTREFIQHLLDADLICSLYKDRVAEAHSKSAIAEMVADANGGEFVCSMIAHGNELDYEDAEEYFKHHFNDRRIFEYAEGYTSQVYCNWSEDRILVKTAQVTLLGCTDVDVFVPSHSCAVINIDPNTTARISAAGGSRVACVYWGEPPVVEGAGARHVKLIKGE